MALVSACTLLKKSDAELYGHHSSGANAGGGAVGSAGGEGGVPGAAGDAGEAAGGTTLGGSSAGGATGGAGASGGTGNPGGTSGTSGTGGTAGAGGSTTSMPCPKFGNYPVAQDPESGHCFVGVSDKFYFNLGELTAACASLGAGFQLASIRSSAEAAAASSVQARMPQGSYLIVGYVQAAGSSAIDKGWSWLDGSPNGFGSFIGWAPTEPNDGNDDVEDGTEDCTAYVPEGLVDTYCTPDSFPLCEGPP